jgi:hypothetical protein
VTGQFIIGVYNARLWVIDPKDNARSSIMNIVSGAVRVVTKTADATTAAAGAVGGAAFSGVVGGIQGTATGLRNGLSNGSQSPAAAALTLAAVGTAGLVEWPILLAVGGTALVVHQLNQRSGQAKPVAAQRAPASAQVPHRASSNTGSTTTRTARPAPAKTTKATKASKASKAPKATKRAPTKSRRTTAT